MSIYCRKVKIIYERLLKDEKIVMKIRENGKILCYLAIEDPLRKDSYEAIQKLKTLGIKTVMITGDNYQTASFVAKKLGIETESFLVFL